MAHLSPVGLCILATGCSDHYISQADDMMLTRHHIHRPSLCSRPANNARVCPDHFVTIEMP